MNEPLSISPSAINSTGVTLLPENVARPRAHFGDAISCLPAYLALFIAIGAGCFTLGSSLSLSGISTYLWYALIINLFISYGLECGNRPIHKLCGWARVLSLVFLPLCTLLVNSAIMAPLDAEAAVNEMVAVMIGGVTVMSVLAIGATFSTHTVPISAPLVPALSFFALLNSLSVNTVNQVCFIVFAAATIFLIAYERMLVRRSRGTTAVNVPDNRRHAAFVSRIAGSYLVACGVWFGLFLTASALLYYPIETLLPQLIGDPWSRSRRRGDAATDWRGSASHVQLRGGLISLSDTVMMQVSMKGIPPALWRGRVYEHYSGSRWEINQKAGETIDIQALNASPVHIPKLETEAPLAEVTPALVRDGDVVDALIEPESGQFKNLFFPGRPQAIQTQGISQLTVDSDGIVSVLGSYYFMGWPYNLQARLSEENPAALLSAPGLPASALKQWRDDPATSPTLEVMPDRQTAQARIRSIAADIQQKARAAGRPLVTPYAKGVAVRDFLLSGYTYSLASPPVPMNEDAVIFFLTNSRQGACDMFASAAALLLRAMDVPARLATGYLATEAAEPSNPDAAPNPRRAGIEGNVAMSFPLRERDAHAWVEYYIPRAGWLTMDPTEGTRTTEVPIQAQIAQLLRLPQFNISWPIVALTVFGVALLLTGILWPLLSKGKLAAMANGPVDLERLRIAEAYTRAVSLLKRQVPYRSHYTPQEYEAAVAASPLPVAAQQEFAALTYLSIAARYATTPPAVAPGELETCLQRLQEGLK